MELSELSIRLLLLFLPGIIATIIIDTLTEHYERKSLDFFIYSFILGIGSYLFLYLTVGIFKVLLSAFFFYDPKSWEINFLECIYNVNQKINIFEVGFGCISGIILALLICYSINHKLLNRFAKWLDISRKFGDLDVWGYVFNSEEVEWILIRDYEKDLMYEGWVGAFSATVKDGELFLRDVIVYRISDGTELYRLDGMYITLNRDRKDVIIEIRELSERGGV